MSRAGILGLSPNIGALEVKAAPGVSWSGHGQRLAGLTSQALAFSREIPPLPTSFPDGVYQISELLAGRGLPVSLGLG